MIKILYLLDALHWGETAAGTEGQFLHLLTSLDRARFDPHLALFRPTPFVERATAMTCPVRVLGVGKLAHPAALLKLGALALWLRARRFDLVHIFFNDASIVAPPFCRLGGARVIVSRRDMGFWYTRRTLRALRVSNLFVNRVIANSDAVRRNVHVREAVNLAKIDVCRNGHDPARLALAADPSFRARLGIGEGSPIVGMVANFNPWKRHVDLVDAFARVHQRHPAAHLVLIGSGPTAAVRAAAAARRLDRVVHIVEDVTEVMPLVKHFAVGVLCSDSEGSSNAVVEYMGAGVPVVCTNVGGNGELVDDGGSGFLVAPGDVPLLADRIGRVLDRPRDAAAMGASARRAAARLTLSRMVESHMDVYQQLGHR